jgi:hypothetical protein
MQMVYPVEGDTALAEILFDDEIVAELRLVDIALDTVGEERVAGATVRIRIFGSFDVDADGLQGMISRARDRLLENERGRLPESR